MSSKQKHKIKVGVFGIFYPHYRNGVFSLLSSSPRACFRFHGAKSASGTFLAVNPETYEYDFRETWTRRIKIPLLNKTITLQPYAVWAMLTGKFDVYIMSQDTLRPSVWCNLILSHILGKKVCLWGQGKSYPPNKTTWFLRSIMFKLAHGVIFYTEGVRDEWIKEGLTSHKLFVAHNALDTQLSDNLIAQNDENSLREFLQTKNLHDKDIIVFIGRLFRDWKKPHLAVQAMEKVIAQHPKAHLVVIGDGPEKSSLEQLAQNLNIQQHVSLVGAVYDEQVTSKYLLAAKMLVIPGKGGLGVQHGMGYGLPVITNDHIEDQSPEIELMHHGVTGLFFRYDDVNDLSRCILQLLADESKRKTMGQNALHLIRTKYNVDNMSQGIMQAVLGACNGKSHEENTEHKTTIPGR